MTSSLPLAKPSIRLITFPVSHYCEKARWALTRLNIPYIEERHAPLFHRFVTRQLGGTSVPILVTKTDILTDSTDILKYLDATAPDDAKLYPTDAEQRQQVEELEEIFDTQLGTLTRVWAYSYTLSQPQPASARFTEGVPLLEKALFPVVFPLVRLAIRRQLQISSEYAAQAYVQIQQIFEKVGNLLADGRSYLVSDRFSAADLTFAALSTPAVRPPEYGSPTLEYSNLEKLPAKMAAQVQAFRDMAAGQFALRLWRDRTGDTPTKSELDHAKR